MGDRKSKKMTIRKLFGGGKSSTSADIIASAGPPTSASAPSASVSALISPRQMPQVPSDSKSVIFDDGAIESKPTQHFETEPPSSPTPSTNRPQSTRPSMPTSGLPPTPPRSALPPPPMVLTRFSFSSFLRPFVSIWERDSTVFIEAEEVGRKMKSGCWLMLADLLIVFGTNWRTLASQHTELIRSISVDKPTTKSTTEVTHQPTKPPIPFGFNTIHLGRTNSPPLMHQLPSFQYNGR